MKLPECVHPVRSCTTQAAVAGGYQTLYRRASAVECYRRIRSCEHAKCLGQWQGMVLEGLGGHR
jgi:hypothetical protein